MRQRKLASRSFKPFTISDLSAASMAFCTGMAVSASCALTAHLTGVLGIVVIATPGWALWYRLMHSTDTAAPERYKAVGCFVALSESSRRQFIVAGLPEDRLVVKPNFMSDPGTPPECLRRGALFVGRLSPEKGLQTLLRHGRVSIFRCGFSAEDRCASTSAQI